MISEQNRNEAYLELLSSEKITPQQNLVYEALFNNPDSTDQELSAITGLPMSSINGRRNELVELNLISEVGKKWCEETNSWRTTWRILKNGESTTQALMKPNCLSHERLEKVIKDIRKMNSFQRKKIKELIEVLGYDRKDC